MRTHPTLTKPLYVVDLKEHLYLPVKYDIGLNSGYLEHLTRVD